MEDCSRVDLKAKLYVYLSVSIQENKEGFDVLKWWKINLKRFNTGDNILMYNSSSLSFKVVEALICMQDWLWTSYLDIEEELEAWRILRNVCNVFKLEAWRILMNVCNVFNDYLNIFILDFQLIIYNFIFLIFDF